MTTNGNGNGTVHSHDEDEPQELTAAALHAQCVEMTNAVVSIRQHIHLLNNAGYYFAVDTKAPPIAESTNGDQEYRPVILAYFESDDCRPREERAEQFCEEHFADIACYEQEQEQEGE